MRRSERKGLALSAAFAATLGLASCHQHAPPPEQRAYHVEKDLVRVARKGPIAFELTVAKEGPSLPLPPVTARITTVEALTSPSFAPLAGHIVESNVHLGDQVSEGQSLVRVRTADLPVLEREVRSAALSVNTRTASVERMRALVASRAGSEHDLILAQSELEEARLALAAATSRLKSLHIARAQDDTAFWVLATRSGTVVQLDATPGLQVGPERGPIATVADLAQVLAVADLPQRDAIELRKGAKAEIFPFGAAGGSVPGTVEVISEVVDPERQTVPVRVLIDNAKHILRPNAYVDLVFGAAQARTTVLLPAVAVVRDGADAVVFVETRPGAYMRRSVVLGRKNRDEVEVVSGVAPGERVVTTGALLLLNALDIEARAGTRERNCIEA